jgi:glycosyltransferase involved in cell wall biosynthesis
LAQVLESCIGQRVDDSLIEILIVLDGIDDESRVAFDQFQFRLREIGRPLCTRLVQPWDQSHGLASARNVCADEARGRWIRFQDDDDVLDPYACAWMLAEHARYDRQTAILGYTGVVPQLYELPLMHYLFSEGLEMFCYRLAEHNQRLGFDWFWGGRTSVETDLVRKTRFDEGFDVNNRFATEDIEFAFRASIERNLSVVYSTSVRSYMIRALDLDSFLKRCYRQGISARYAAEKHPGTPLELWALHANLYSQWEGDGCAVLSQAAKRCRRLEVAVDLCQQGIGRVEAVRETLSSAYRESFGLARAVGFLGHALPSL